MSLTVKKLTTSAVFAALLIVVQLALSPLAGVELVTVLFLAYCTVFGIAMGCITATAFSLLRCLLFGVNPTVIVLYLIYYNAFALLFGFIGRRGKRLSLWICPLLLAFLIAFCGYFAVAGLPVSVLVKGRMTAMLWALFAIFCVLLVLYGCLLVFGRGKARLAAIVVLAALCTVCFTLLDDLITPLFYGYGTEARLAYFYAGFTVMLPQTICTVVTVSILFYPLEKTFLQASKWLRK